MKYIDSILQAGQSIKGLLAVFNSLFLFVPKCLDGWNVITSGSKKRDGKQSKIALCFCVFIVVFCVILVVLLTTTSTSARENSAQNTSSSSNIPPYWGQSTTLGNRQIATYDSRNRNATCKVLLESKNTTSASGYTWTRCHDRMPSSAPVIVTSSTDREDSVPYIRKSQSIATSPRISRQPVAYSKNIKKEDTFQSPSVAKASQNWQQRNHLARIMTVHLSQGAQCKKYATGDYGCFPLLGSPSQYEWNSYSKGTPLSYGGIAPKDHQAIDIYTSKHTPVFSVWDGVVRASYEDSNGIGGNTIIIEHKQEHLATVYVHLHYRGVKVGDIVKAGQIIGSVGSTGRTLNDHLHFRIHDMTKTAYKISKVSPLTEYEIVSLAPFAGIKKGNFHGEHLVAHLKD